MTRQAFSVFSTDSEGSDRPVDENNFIFLKMLLGSQFFFSEKWEISKKNLGKIKIFGFLRITFFWKTFLKNPNPIFCAGWFYVDCRASQHSRRSRSRVPNFFRLFFHKNLQFFGFSRYFVPWCSAMFHRVPPCDFLFLVVSRTFAFQNTPKHHSTVPGHEKRVSNKSWNF